MWLCAGCATSSTKIAKPRWQTSQETNPIVSSSQNNPPSAQPPPTAPLAPSPLEQNQPFITLEPMQSPPQKALLAIVLPLSGPYAVHGQRALVAAQLALGVSVQDIRQEPFEETLSGLHVRVIDSEGSIQQMQQHMELLQQEASVIVGALVPQVARALAVQCQSAEIPFISLANRQDIAQTGSWIFGMPLTLQQQIDALVRWSIDKKDMHRFAILYPRNRYGQQALEALRNAVQQYRQPVDPVSTHEPTDLPQHPSVHKQDNTYEAEVVAAESYEPEETTFTTPIRQLVRLHPIKQHPQYASCYHKAAQQAVKGTKEFVQARRECISALPSVVDFDVLLLPAVAETVSYIVPALISQDILVSQDPLIKKQFQIATQQENVKPVQLLGTNLWNDPQLHQRLQQSTGRLGEHMEGAVFVDGATGEQDGLSGQRFVETFQEQAGSTPSWWESRVYDVVMLASTLLRNTTTCTTKQLLRHHVQSNLLEGAAEVTGVTGPLSFDSNGNWIPALTQFVIQEKAVRKNPK